MKLFFELKEGKNSSNGFTNKPGTKYNILKINVKMLSYKTLEVKIKDIDAEKIYTRKLQLSKTDLIDGIYYSNGDIVQLTKKDINRVLKVSNESKKNI